MTGIEGAKHARQTAFLGEQLQETEGIGQPQEWIQYAHLVIEGKWESKGNWCLAVAKVLCDKELKGTIKRGTTEHYPMPKVVWDTRNAVYRCTTLACPALSKLLGKEIKVYGKHLEGYKGKDGDFVGSIKIKSCNLSPVAVPPPADVSPEELDLDKPIYVHFEGKTEGVKPEGFATYLQTFGLYGDKGGAPFVNVTEYGVSVCCYAEYEVDIVLPETVSYQKQTLDVYVGWYAELVWYIDTRERHCNHHQGGDFRETIKYLLQKCLPKQFAKYYRNAFLAVLYFTLRKRGVERPDALEAVQQFEEYEEILVDEHQKPTGILLEHLNDPHLVDKLLASFEDQLANVKAHQVIIEDQGNDGEGGDDGWCDDDGEGGDDN